MGSRDNYDTSAYVRRSKNPFRSLGIKPVKQPKVVKTWKICVDCGDDFLTYKAERCYDCYKKYYNDQKRIYE